MQATSVPISEAFKHITVNVTVTGLTKAFIKMNIGIFLIKIATKIMGVGLKVDIISTEKPTHTPPPPAPDPYFDTSGTVTPKPVLITRSPNRFICSH